MAELRQPHPDRDTGPEAVAVRDPGQFRDRYGRHARGPRRRQVPLHLQGQPLHGDEPDRRGLRAQPHASRGPGGSAFRRCRRTRARQPGQGHRAERRCGQWQQAHRRDRDLRHVPRAARPARRPAAFGRVLRHLPQPRLRRSGQRQLGGHGVHGPLDSRWRGPRELCDHAADPDALHRLRLLGPDRFRRRHLSAVAALLRQVPHEVDCDARRRCVE